MKEMAKSVPGAASYALATILVDERADGVHLSYDSMASFIAPYGSQAALAVARDLDSTIESLLETAARCQRQGQSHDLFEGRRCGLDSPCLHYL
jgi:hypothetical protein